MYRSTHWPIRWPPTLRETVGRVQEIPAQADARLRWILPVIMGGHSRSGAPNRRVNCERIPANPVVQTSNRLRLGARRVPGKRNSSALFGRLRSHNLRLNLVVKTPARHAHPVPSRRTAIVGKPAQHRTRAPGGKRPAPGRTIITPRQRHTVHKDRLLLHARRSHNARLLLRARRSHSARQLHLAKQHPPARPGLNARPTLSVRPQANTPKQGKLQAEANTQTRVADPTPGVVNEIKGGGSARTIRAGSAVRLVAAQEQADNLQ